MIAILGEKGACVSQNPPKILKLASVHRLRGGWRYQHRSAFEPRRIAIKSVEFGNPIYFAKGIVDPPLALTKRSVKKLREE